MRTILTGDNLKSDYWSHAIRHAVYIKNRLPHENLPGHISTSQRLIGRYLDLAHVRVFGSYVTVRKSMMCRYKLDMDHATTGTFLGATTDHTIWFEDHQTCQLRYACHVIIDKAHYSADNRPPYKNQLMKLTEEHLTQPHAQNPSASTLPLHLIPEKEKYLHLHPLTHPSLQNIHIRYYLLLMAHLCSKYNTN